MDDQTPHTKIVSVVNQKGGVAKTTTCANLGACLAQKGLPTLLLDLDPQANLTLGLGGEGDDPPYSLPAVLFDSAAAPLAGIVHQVGDLPLYLAPGHLEMAQCEIAMIRQEISAYNLRVALQRLLERYPFAWVLIDCPPSLGLLTQNAILASTHLLVPTEPKMYALAGIDILSRLVEHLAQEHEFRIELLGVLLTLYEKNTKLHRIITTVIRERFGEKVFDTLIYKNVRLSEAEVEGTPVSLFDRRASGTQNYEALATEVLCRAGE